MAKVYQLMRHVGADRSHHNTPQITLLLSSPPQPVASQHLSPSAVTAMHYWRHWKFIVEAHTHTHKKKKRHPDPHPETLSSQSRSILHDGSSKAFA